jgi:hypothetical protein
MIQPATARNNIIQKGLAFVREQSGSVTVPGTRRASGSCPAGCMAKVGDRIASARHEIQRTLPQGSLIFLSGILSSAAL